MAESPKQLLRKRMVARIEHITRLGEPFAYADIPNKELVDLATRIDAERPNWEMNQIFNIVLGLASFRGTLWRRFDLVSGKPERREGQIVLYPSNDRERFRLKDNEKFLAHHITGAMLRKSVEPPLRLRNELVAESPGATPIVPFPVEEAAEPATNWRALALALADTVSTLTRTIDDLARAGRLQEE